MRLFRVSILTLTAISSLVTARAQVIGEMFASDASVRGSVLFSSSGTQIQSGSSVTAGDAPAVVKVRRGGEVRICPNTTISVSSSANGRELLWGMNTGSIESHFTLDASADTIMTPDFRILLAGPGIFHFAISSDSKGNACVRALPSNTASLIVSEMNGQGTYQVKPNVQVLFHNGTVAEPSPFVPPDCGCPAPQPVVERAAAPVTKEPAASTPPPAPVKQQMTPTVPPPSVFQSPLPPASEDLASVAVLPPNSNVHLQMETPLVYSPGSPEMEMVMAVSRLRLTAGSNFDKPSVLPPPQPTQPAPAPVQEAAKAPRKKGFFGKIGSFFSSIFK